jgi:predicted permease
MSTLVQDLRYALRAFSRNPGFTATAVLSLAIGIGANTSIFSVASALLLHPLPYRDAYRLVILWNRSPGLGITEDWFSTAQYFDIRTRHQGFEQVAIAIGGNYNLTGYAEPERVGTIRISSNLLPMLGVQPRLGRLFTEVEDAPGAAPSALLSYGTWSRRYGNDPQILGKSIALNGQTYHIAGVLPQSFSLSQEVMPTLGRAEQAEILLPLPLPASAVQNRDHEDYNIVGKLKRGVSVQRAQAEMDALTASLRRDHPDVYPPNGGLTFGIVPLLDQVVGDVRRSLMILIGSVGFVLLIACANVANLLLSRALARQKEIAVRAALGAGRGRIVRQLLTESVVLAVVGGTLGVLLAIWSLRWIHVLGPKSVPRLQEIGINGEVLLFTLALSLVSGIIFGLAPAMRVSKLDLHMNLKDASRGSSTGSIWGRGNHLRKLLVVSELALSVMLLIGAGLLIRSFANLQKVQPGFSATNVLTFELTMTGRQYNNGQAVLQAYRRLWEQLDRLPGVTAVGGTSALPMSQMYAWGPINVEGRISPPGENFINADERTADWNYFRAMEIPLRRGRLFNEQDNLTSPRVVVVDEHMTEQLWPNQDPIGKRIRHGGLNVNSPWMSVVGVVGRVKQYTLDTDSRIAFYLPHTQSPSRAMTVVVKSATDAAGLVSPVKAAIHEIDSGLPLYQVRTMSQRIDESLARRRFSMLLLGAFAALALTLAMIGTYGVLSYLVNQGAREVGIRIALGASQQHILRLVIGRGMTVALSGVAVGLVGAFALTGLMRSLLFGVTVTDPWTFTAIPVALASVAFLASYVPARRAARIDSILSLRCE